MFVLALNHLQRLKQLNEEIDRKLAAPSSPHIHAAPEFPKQQMALAPKAGSLAPSIEDGPADWTLQAGPAAAPKQLLGESPASGSGERPAAPIYQPVRANPACSHEVGGGMMGPTVGEPAQTMHPAAELLSRGPEYKSLDEKHRFHSGGVHSAQQASGSRLAASLLPAAEMAPQQRTIYIPESSVDTDGVSLRQYSAAASPAPGNLPAHRKSMASAPAENAGGEDGNNFQVSFERPKHGTHREAPPLLSQI
jgi:hypothetical protein